MLIWPVATASVIYLYMHDFNKKWTKRTFAINCVTPVALSMLFYYTVYSTINYLERHILDFQIISGHILVGTIANGCLLSQLIYL